MENFKSFGRKLTIPFLDGFTAITGPNGSGKSNIGDAILFVLGPKSNKAIRAGRLTDLIFNGGKERKPSTHCKVSLTFDNVDRVIPVESDEVTLTRLVKLSKKAPENYYSYFYVNGRPSSLTEFDNLLAHSRISADGYNIVRQGDVLRIVEMTAMERRRVLDDIAGITKFDSDIDRAMKEKDEVEQNLERINIILEEIKRNLETLEREREAALKYKTLKEELDLEKGKLAKKRHDALVAEIASVEKQAVEAEEERERLRETLEGLKEEIEEADKRLEGIDKEIADRGGPEAAELRVKVEGLRGEVIRATERMNYARQEISDLKEDKQAVNADLKRVEKDLAKYGKERDDALAAKAQEEAALEEKRQALQALRDGMAQGQGRAGELTRELAQMKVDYERVESEVGKARVESDRLDDKAERLKATVGELEDQVETHEFEIKDVDWELKEIEKEAGSTSSTVDELKSALFTKKKRQSEVSKQLQDLEPVIRRHQNDYSRLKAEQDASEAVSRGYTRAVDGVITARDKGELTGICGTIAELADVDGKYQTAMEIAAGARMQAIVTESDADAARAIEYLKRNKLGRATFLPLSKMVKGRPAGKPLMAVRDPGAEGFAIDLIQYEEKYTAAFWYVFRDTVIVRDMNVARKLMGGTRLVTLDGDVIDAGGAMTGGDHGGRGRGRVAFGASQKESLEKVAKELRAALTHQETLSGELMQLRSEISDLEDKVREGSHDSSSKEERVKELKKRRDGYAEKLEQLKAEHESRKKDLEETQAERAKVAARVAELDGKLADMEKAREEKGKLLLAATSKDTARELTELEAEVADLREKARDAASQVETRTHSVNLVEERKAELEARLAEIDSEIAGHESTMAESKAVVDEKEKELKVLAEIEAQQNEALRGLQQERDQAFEARADLVARAGKLSDRIDTTGDQIAALKARVPALRDSLSELEEELAQYAELDVPEEITETMEALRGRVRSLENQLDALGNVNMLALEEYDRQAARKDELEGEVEHLVGERENLVQVVDEIQAKKKHGFFKVFHEINENFQGVFAKLSDGGKAELSLENPDEPFEGGLIMRAQPKGKKVTRLEALSGGEKSLTSMAFIFAIQEFDPSPFYYLDEVDQNLDGINSELLAKLVSSNAEHAQFIVVSLRKVTLKEANHVYGVTMMDSGLSEVVGEVRLSEIVEEATVNEEAPEVAP